MTDAFGSMPGREDETVQRIIRPIDQSRGWMKLMAVMLFISGGLAAITIIGLIVAWLPIWMGVLLWQSAGSAEAASKTGLESDAIDSLSRLKTLFTIQGIVTVIYLGLTVLSILFMVVVIMAGSSN